jgi:hypothetical protein
MIPEVAFTDEEWFPDLAGFLPADDMSFRSIGAVFSLGLGIAEELLGVAWDLASCICCGLGISCTASGGCGGGGASCAETCSGSADSSSTSSIGECGRFVRFGRFVFRDGRCRYECHFHGRFPSDDPVFRRLKKKPFRPAKQHAGMNSDREECADSIPSAGSSN